MSYAIRSTNPRDPQPWLASVDIDGDNAQWTADERKARRFGTRASTRGTARLWAPGVVEVVPVSGEGGKR